LLTNKKLYIFLFYSSNITSISLQKTKKTKGGLQCLE